MVIDILCKMENPSLEDCINMFEIGNAVMIDNGVLTGYMFGSDSESLLESDSDYPLESVHVRKYERKGGATGVIYRRK